MTINLYPHGKPQAVATGKIVAGSPEEGLMVAEFHEGCVMTLYRVLTVDGEFIGPWIELWGGGHYEVG